MIEAHVCQGQLKHGNIQYHKVLCHLNIFLISSNFHCYKLIEAYREQLNFIGKEGELLEVKVILEIDINWSQCL